MCISIFELIPLISYLKCIFIQLWHKSFLWFDSIKIWASRIIIMISIKFDLKVTRYTFSVDSVEAQNESWISIIRNHLSSWCDNSPACRIFSWKKDKEVTHRSKKVKKVSERFNARWKSFDVRCCYTPNRLKQIKINAVSLSQVG